ncbi:MAG: GNAT family N-acetyltransferase [Boseongicola sp.]|nr:GNAT family N-acetyltransferase [Boseongicola sp.]
MIIRPAVEGDAGRLAEIQNPVIRDTAITFNPRERSETEMRVAVRDRPCFLVAEVGGRVMGFASYDQFRKGPGYARTVEHTIVISEEGRGQGMGRALMDAIVEHARDAGIGSIWAGVSGENPAGVAFHASLGFEEVARLPKVGYKFGRWMDLVLLRKCLDEACQE